MWVCLLHMLHQYTTSTLPGLLLANSSSLQRPRALSVMQVVLEHLSYGPGSPFLGEPSIFARARGNTERVWGPACLLSVAHRHGPVLSLSPYICRMWLQILTGLGLRVRHLLWPAPLRAPHSYAAVPILASQDVSGEEFSAQSQGPGSNPSPTHFCPVSALSLPALLHEVGSHPPVRRDL